MSKRWLQYKVCYMGYDPLKGREREQTLFATTNYLEASEFASKYDINISDEVYIKSVWKTSIPPKVVNETRKEIQLPDNTVGEQQTGVSSVGNDQKDME